MYFVNSRFMGQHRVNSRAVRKSNPVLTVDGCGGLMESRMDLGLLKISDLEQPLETVCFADKVIQV